MKQVCVYIANLVIRRREMSRFPSGRTASSDVLHFPKFVRSIVHAERAMDLALEHGAEMQD